MVNWPKLKIGNLEIDVPIIQGGMGVKISCSGLASAVANEGGVGVIASVGLGDHENFKGSYEEANVIALRKEIKKTREMTNGIFGVNVMYALSDSDKLIETTVNERVRLLFMGAGFKSGLPEIIKGSDTMAVPIISYAKFIPHILNAWGKYDYQPAAIVIEGPKAGGHLGYGRRKLERKEFVENSLEKEVKKAVEVVDGLNIPIIAAGGIFTGEDIYDALSWGASGVQMGTRFVTTDECDADIEFKKEYLRAKKEDIILIDSPVGLPGRAVSNDFLKGIMSGKKKKFPCPYQCLTKCDPNDSPYCIAAALKNAGKGNLENGFAFAGANAHRCNEIISVKDLTQELSSGYSSAVINSGIKSQQSF